VARLGRGAPKRVSAVPEADQRVDAAAVDVFLASLGRDGPLARELDAAVDSALAAIRSLSVLTEPLALDYLERQARPIPDLSPEQGAQIMARAYAAHLATEEDPPRFGARDVPVLGTFPPLRKGSAPQGLLVRVVKASRRNFELIRAVPAPVWEGFVRILTRRTHDLVPEGEGLVPVVVVDGLARVGWILRQVDIHYGLAPQRR
jgi:hypothetical protein